MCKRERERERERGRERDFISSFPVLVKVRGDKGQRDYKMIQKDKR